MDYVNRSSSSLPPKFFLHYLPNSKVKPIPRGELWAFSRTMFIIPKISVKITPPFSSVSRLSSLMSKSMPTLHPSPHRQQWGEVAIGCAGVVSFSDSSCGANSREDPSLPYLLHGHRNLLILHWERYLQVKDFCRDCSNFGDSFDFSLLQYNQIKALSVNTQQEWFQCSQDHARNLVS